MYKQFLSSFLLFFLSFSVSAEYLGIEEMPVGDHEISKVINEAINKSDYALMNEWKSSMAPQFNEKGFCAFSERSFGKVEIKGKQIEKSHTTRDFAYLMMQPYYAIVPTTCDEVYIWNAYRKLPNKRYSPDIFELVKSTKNHKYIEQVNDYTKKREVIINILNQIPEDQYQLFLPVILDEQSDFKIRHLALDKFLSGYEQSEKNNSETFKSLRDKMKLANEENQEWSFDFNSKSYMAVSDPKMLLLTQMNGQVLNKLSDYTTLYNSDPDLYPAFTKSILKNGGFSNEELVNMKLDNLRFADLNTFNNANETLKLFSKVFYSYQKDHDLNFQADNGNTIFMDIFSKRKMSSIARNKFAGVFVRFYLESGANPLLENKDRKTAYSMFIESFREGAEGKDVKDAFVKKQYDFSKD